MSAIAAIPAVPASRRLSPLRGARWLFGGPLLSPIATVAASAIIPVGPWLVSVMALAVISLTLTPVLGRGVSLSQGRTSGGALVPRQFLDKIDRLIASCVT